MGNRRKRRKRGKKKARETRQTTTDGKRNANAKSSMNGKCAGVDTPQLDDKAGCIGK